MLVTYSSLDRKEQIFDIYFMVKICFISNNNVLDGEFAFWDKEKCSVFPLKINTFHHHPDLSTMGGGGRAIKK